MQWIPAVLLLAVAGLLVPGFMDQCRSLSERNAVKAAVLKHRNHAQAAIKAGEFDRASIALEAARALTPTDPAIQTEMMRLRVRHAAEQPQALSDADLRVVDYALELTGRDGAVALTAAAQLELRKKQGDAGILLLGKAIEADPNFVPAHLAKGSYHRGRGEKIEAQRAYEKALELEADNLTTLNNLGVVYVDLGRHEDAVNLFKRAIDKRDNAATRLNIANALVPLKRNSEALEHLKSAAQAEPRSAEIWRRLGALLHLQKELPEAEQALLRALEIERDPNTAYVLGLVLQGQKRYKRAADVLQQVLQAEPRHANAAYQLGATLQVLGDAKGTVAALHRFMQITEGVESEKKRRAEVEGALRKLATPPGQKAPPGGAKKPPTPPGGHKKAPSPPAPEHDKKKKPAPDSTPKP